MRCLWCGYLIARGTGAKWERARRIYNREKHQHEIVTSQENLHATPCNEKRIAYLGGRQTLR